MRRDCRLISYCRGVIAVFAMGVLCHGTATYACGGGWAPMVFTSPTGTEQSESQNDQKSSFYRVDRGVTYDMFNDKKLQPVIQRILSKGNRRADRDEEDKKENAENDSTAVVTSKRSEKNKKNDKAKKANTRVLNVKNLH